MKNRLYILLAIFCLTVLDGCKKIEMKEEQNSSETQVEGNDVTDRVKQSEGPINFRGYSTLDEYLGAYGSLSSPIPCEDLLPGGCVYRSVTEEGTLAKVQSCWVEGIIVGAVDGNTMKRVIFGTQGMVESNIVLAAKADENNNAQCLPVQLTTSNAKQKEVREKLNLALHPENLGVSVKVQGVITKYLGTIGIKNASSTYLEGDEQPEEPTGQGDTEDPGDMEDPDETEEPTEPNDDSTDDTDMDIDMTYISIGNYIEDFGAADNPIPVSHMLEGGTLYDLMLSSSSSDADVSCLWIEGYIVGYVSGTSMSKTVFGTDGAHDRNIVLATSVDETNYTYCVPVQLNGYVSKEVRNRLNLKDRPDNLGRHVRLQGQVDWFMGQFTLGLKGTFNYYFYTK